jgi:hypothetical protein
MTIITTTLLRTYLPTTRRYSPGWALATFTAGFITVRQLRLCWCGELLWREDGSVFCICCWPLPTQSFSGPSPLGLATIIYSLRFEIFFSLHPTTRIVVVEVFDLTSTPLSPLTCLSGKFLVFYYLMPTGYRTRSSSFQFLVSVVTVCVRFVSEMCVNHCLAKLAVPCLGSLFQLLAVFTEQLPGNGLLAPFPLLGLLGVM